MSEAMVLSADIGGTKTNLAICRGTPAALEVVAEANYLNREARGFDELVERFLSETRLRAVSACFGVAGAVVDGRCDMPNLGWRLDSQELAGRFDLERVKLLNDLEATALGIDTLPSESLFTLNSGRPLLGGNRALIAAGTGLGEAFLFRCGSGYQVAASEGGHVDFAPRNEEEIELLRHLSIRFGHVSCERVVSGPGLVNIYTFLRDRLGMEEPAWLAQQLSSAKDRAAVIAQAGIEGKAEICIYALDLLMDAYGAAAGNLALKALATGGLYLGGGIAPKLLDKLREGRFMAAFTDKGRFHSLLEGVPVQVILDPKTALRGAAAYLLGHQ